MAVYWVKETVNADVVGTVDTYGDPYGIQQAFDDCSLGDEIRIVGGVNNYGSASASWNNRDATKRINVAQPANGFSNHVRVLGYLDETTPGLITLNFNGGTGDGLYNSVSDYYFQQIHAQQASQYGFHLLTGGHNTLYKCQASQSGSHGFYPSSQGNRLINCYALNNTGTGIYTSTSSNLYFCQAVGNNHGISLGQQNLAAFCLANGNTNKGFELRSSNQIDLLNCLSYGNGANGIEANAGTVRYVIINTATVGHNGVGQVGLKSAVGQKIAIEIGCAFYDNTTNVDDSDVVIDRVTTNPEFIDADGGDFSLGINWKALGAPSSYLAGLANYLDIGPVQRQEAAAVEGSALIDNAILDHLLGRSVYTPPALLYLALSTTNPGADGSGVTEPAGNGYARKAIANDTDLWPDASGGSKSNAYAITFDAASGGAWGTITHFVLYDAPSGGTPLFYGALDTPVAVTDGEAPSFAASALTFNAA